MTRAGLATLVAAGITLTVSAPVAGERQERVKLCDPAEVTRVVDRFVAAFNTGNTRRLDSLFARKPYFRWYSTDARESATSPSLQVAPASCRTSRAGMARGRD